MRKPFFIALAQYEGIIKKYFTHTVGYPINNPIYYKDVTPSRDSQFIQTTILPQEVL